MKKTLILLTTTTILILSTKQECWAWSNHAEVTRSALRMIPELTKQQVIYHPFDSLLSKLTAAYPSIDLSTTAKFNAYLLIDRNFKFSDDLKLGEYPGSTHSYLDVLSSYADEPDRNMDIAVFDQYPDSKEMQDAKAKYGTIFPLEGTGSQFFRHAYMPPWSASHPIVGYRIDHTFENLGEAPSRSRLFFELARKAMAVGETYWALRFMSNGLHYLEDVSSPFHTRRVVTFKFLTAGFSSKYRKYYTGDATENITGLTTYYHWVFEGFIGHHMATLQGNTPSAAAIKLDQALCGKPGEQWRKMDYIKSTSTEPVEKLVMRMANYSLSYSGPTARAAWAFLPDLIELERTEGVHNTIELTKVMNDKDPSINFYERESWWTNLLATRTFETKEGKKLFKVVEKVYKVQGYAIRQVVKKELGLE